MTVIEWIPTHGFIHGKKERKIQKTVLTVYGSMKNR